MKHAHTKFQSFDMLKGNIPSLVVGSLVLILGSAITGSFVTSKTLNYNHSQISHFRSFWQARNERVQNPEIASPAERGRNDFGDSGVAPLPRMTTEKLVQTTSYYVVQKGDSLARIGFKVCAQKNAWLYIAEDNAKYPPYTLSQGETIKVVCK